MIRPAALFRAVFAAAFFLLGQGAFAAEPFSATVRHCIDGDTVVLDSGQRVRLAGIDTPEKGSRSTPEQYYAREALAFTKQHVAGVKVRVEPLSGTSQDRHKRLVAELRLPDGRSLNELILRQGAGFFYAHKDLPQQLVARLRTAQQEALQQRAGCWNKMLSAPEAQTRYIGNRNSKRFYSPECLKQIPVGKRNQIPFTDLESAFHEGYSPARPCNIWPAVR